MRLHFVLLALPLLFACGTERLPTLEGRDATPSVTPDAGFFGIDTGVEVPDSGAASPDASGGDDASTTPDAGGDDAASGQDAAADGGAGADAAGDASTGDGGGADAAADAGPMPDAGVPDVDSDGDGIFDRHEGYGLIDTDGDGTGDSADPDSDNDGIPDSVEAGDADPLTPPIDTDGDGIPDFRDTDSDGDGIDDAVEGVGDPDGDGIPNYLDLDSDNDFIRDDHDGVGDPDGDGLPNYLDPDSDGDGISDEIEAGDTNLASVPRDVDFDGVPNFLDLDSDGDNISDAQEGIVDTDNDGLSDFVDIDSDNDAILDFVEAGDADVLTLAFDSDLDGTPDYRDLDSDNDTILDLHEGSFDTDGDGTPDRLDLDSDGDGWPDSVEAGDADLLTAPIDTDLDNLPDYRDLDSDADGLADAVEAGCPAGSSRLLQDSDNDTYPDAAELAYGSNPCDGASIIDDFYFVLPPGGPGDDAPLVFSDTQIDRADLAINIDTTGSMSGEIANLRASLSTTIIPGVASVIPDAAFAVSSFEDYPVAPFGDAASGDRPFRLGTRVTTNAATAQAAVNALTTRSGVDFPEAGMESVYQVCTGAGTAWAGGSVAPFNPATNNVPGVADGTIGGVGFRDDSLPIIVHVTDSISHTRGDYRAVSTAITAASTPTVRNALSGIGARVVTISSGLLPFDDLLCAGSISSFFGAITPAADVDWFLLQGAVAGNVVDVEVLADGFLSTLDPMVAVANNTAIIAQNDDVAPTTLDAGLTGVVLTGPPPYFIAITSVGDGNFDGPGGTTTGHYLVNVSVGGVPFMYSPTTCRPDDANARTNATVLVNGTTAVPPSIPAQCLADCDTILGPVSPLFADFTFPYEMSEDTGAVVPPCAWSEFGAGRPTGCAANQCCTGQAGVGVAPNAAGLCPLAFEISPTGAGLDAAMVTGIEALVRAGTFTITTVVREDPAELAATGIDTRCFIQSVIPLNATPPNTCVPQPVAADLLPPTPELDSWQNVTPGTVLEFQVNALNQSAATQMPCAPALNTPRLFNAFIDVVADGVTVVDTRQVIIIVPPNAPGGGN